MTKLVEINDVGAFGSVADTEAFMLPPEIFSEALNARCYNNGIEALKGWSGVFGTPPVAPHFLLPYLTPSKANWIYTSLTKGYVFDGTSHTNITRQTVGVDVDYNAGETRNWNGTILGGVPILNNYTDVPQYWPSVAGKLSALPNWPSTLRAKVVRAYGPYLVAIHLLDNTTLYPHLIQWSHPADPGSVPASWDYTDASVEAGRKDLPDVNSGSLVDALPLRSTMFLYKENSIWKMNIIGGRFVFSFDTFLENVGLLSPRGVTITGDGRRHVVPTQDDIIWHDGSQFESILNERQRRRLFNELDASYYVNSFSFTNSAYDEVWFCYPTSGSQHPDKALILNYSDPKSWKITEVDGISFRNASAGSVENVSADLWSSGSDTWAEDTGPWSVLTRRKTVVASPSNTKFYGLDEGATRDGATFTVRVQRVGLSILGQDRKGKWIVDYKTFLSLNRIWPKVLGGPVTLRVGVQQTVDGAVEWAPATTFDPATQVFSDFFTADGSVLSGRSLAIEFSTTSAVSWRLLGYSLELNILGMF